MKSKTTQNNLNLLQELKRGFKDLIHFTKISILKVTKYCFKWTKFLVMVGIVRLIEIIVMIIIIVVPVRESTES